MDGVGGGPGMSPASVQPHIPSFPAIPAKTKAEEAAVAPCRMCWGVQSSSTAVPGSREGGPRGFAEAQGQECDARARSGRGGGCLEGFVPFQPRVRHSPRGRDVALSAPSSPPRALPSPALAGGGSTGEAALGFGNLIRAVPEAGAALASPAGAGAAEQVWARLLHGSGQNTTARWGPPEKPLVLWKELPGCGVCWRQERGSC